MKMAARAASSILVRSVSHVVPVRNRHRSAASAALGYSEVTKQLAANAATATMQR